jgi:hypothetical protein
VRVNREELEKSQKVKNVESDGKSRDPEGRGGRGELKEGQKSEVLRVEKGLEVR